MNTLTLEARAKINLYLDVKEKRADGYHEIESVMQSLSLCDLVTVTRSGASEDRHIAVTCSDPAVPTDCRNIVWKCAEAFFRHFAVDSYDISINIDKHIPSSAGLAGGSSDGAATLKLLNLLYNTRATLEELCAIGAAAGADIPFCLTGGTCLCRGIGEILTPVAIPKPAYHILVAFPGDGVSTPEAYRLLDETPASTPSPSPDALLDQLRSGALPMHLHNAFERAILPIHPKAAALKARIAELGADAVLMSGSGPSVFGVFRENSRAEEARAVLCAEQVPAYAAQPV